MNESIITIIVPASHVETFRAIAAVWPYGGGMFITPLYTDKTVTHYISTGYIDNGVVALFENPEMFAAVVNSKGGSMTVEEAEQLQSLAVISKEDPMSMLGSLELNLTNPIKQMTLGG